MVDTKSRVKSERDDEKPRKFDQMKPAIPEHTLPPMKEEITIPVKLVPVMTPEEIAAAALQAKVFHRTNTL